MLQVRRLVEQGACAAVLPNVGMTGLNEKSVLCVPFKPLADYGRVLVLHWNPRQVRRRGVSDQEIKALARILRRS